MFVRRRYCLSKRGKYTVMLSPYPLCFSRMASLPLEKRKKKLLRGYPFMPFGCLEGVTASQRGNIPYPLCLLGRHLCSLKRGGYTAIMTYLLCFSRMALLPLEKGENSVSKVSLCHLCLLGRRYSLSNRRESASPLFARKELLPLSVRKIYCYGILVSPLVW